jgi:transcriptional regulator with XRE-family HTH domain
MSKNVQFNLRIPAELKAFISDASKASGRSINAEAQYRLEQSFESQGGSYMEAVEELRHFFDAHLRSNRLRVLAHKLNFLLSEAQAVDSLYTPSISRIAEALGYNSVGMIEDWFEGRKEPSFAELKKLAKYFACQENWLIHDENKPFKTERFEFGFDIEDNASRLMKGDDGNEVTSLWFARNNTENGELIVIKHYDGWHGSVLSTRVHVSNKVGVGGSEHRALLSLTLKYLCKHHLQKIKGALISELDYNELIWAKENPIKIIDKYHHNPWIEDMWDSSMYSKKSNNYWKGWHEMCMSNAFYIHENELLSRVVV